MRQGERGEAVGILQVALRDLGFDMPISFQHVFPDGIYGAETAAQVKQFQLGQGVAGDGIAGRDTWAALDAAFRDDGGSAPPPFPQPDLTRVVFFSPPGPVSPPDVPPLPLAKPGPPLVQPRFRPRITQAGFAPTSSGPATTAPVTAPLAAPVLIGKRAINNCGDPNSDDFKANDFPNPKIGPLEKASLDFLRKRPRIALLLLWRSTFDSLYNTGPLGQSMITRFMAGTGGVLTHTPGSDLSNTAKSTATFKASHAEVKTEIDKQFAAQFAQDGDVDVSKLSIIVNIPFSTFSKDITVPRKFRAMIGGIHGIQLFATEFDRTGVGSYTMKLLYKICDNFGVGNDDLYSPDLQAMWILQHETAGTAPFVNSMEIEETISGTFPTVF
jgi:hypothetical protein